MPSPILTTYQYEAAIAQEYNGKGYIATVSNTVVFQAEVASVTTGNDFAQISFTNVTTGSYLSIREGMTLLLSTDLTNYKSGYFRGRVRKPPTSSIVYVNEMSEALTVGDIITVINTYEPRELARRLTFVDWDKPFEDLAPIIKNMQSAYAAITTAGEAQFSFAPIGQAMAEGATIASYAWEIPGATYDVGDDETQNITVTIPDTTEWGRLTITDSNDVSSWFVFSIHIGHPATDSRFLMMHDPVNIDMALETGYNASATVYGNLAGVMDRTRCVVIVDETYGSEPDPELGNVRFVGYLTKDSSTTRGDAQYGVVASTQIEMQGLLAAAAEIGMVPIAVRDVDPPVAWDDIDTPTTQRVIAHILTRHSNIPNLCAIDFGTLDNTWFGSNFDITDTSLMDAVRTVGSEINASLVSDAAGQLVFEIHASFRPEDERDDLPFVVPENLNAGNVFEFSLERVHTPRVGKVEMGARVFFEDGSPSVGYTAMAPAVAYGQGPERVQIPNALLPAGADATDAGQRAAFWFSFKNNTIVLSGQLTDGFGWLSPSTAQWWPFSITATDSVRGIVITSDTRWLLVSARTVINEDGTQSVNGQWIPETMAGRALILVAKSPSVIETALPIVPVRGAIGAYPPRASINYDTVDPTSDKKQRRNPFSGWQVAPWPTKEAAQAANKQASPGERVQSPPINFRNESNVSSVFTLESGEVYRLKLSGSAAIGAIAGLVESLDFQEGPQGFVGLPVPSGLPYAIHHPGEGFGPGTDDIGRIGIQNNLGFQYVQAVFYFNEPMDEGAPFCAVLAYPYPPYTLITSVGGSSDVYDTGPYTATDGFACDMGQVGVVIPSTLRLIRLELTREGTSTRYADAFYTWQVDADGNIFDVLPHSGGGFFINDVEFSPRPAFNRNHEYTVTFMGTGSPVNVRFEDIDHTDNQSAILNLIWSGPGAGQ